MQELGRHEEVVHRVAPVQVGGVTDRRARRARAGAARQRITMTVESLLVPEEGFVRRTGALMIGARDGTDGPGEMVQAEPGLGGHGQQHGGGHHATLRNRGDGEPVAALVARGHVGPRHVVLAEGQDGDQELVVGVEQFDVRELFGHPEVDVDRPLPPTLLNELEPEHAAPAPVPVEEEAHKLLPLGEVDRPAVEQRVGVTAVQQSLGDLDDRGGHPSHGTPHPPCRHGWPRAPVGVKLGHGQERDADPVTHLRDQRGSDHDRGRQRTVRSLHLGQ